LLSVRDDYHQKSWAVKPCLVVGPSQVAFNGQRVALLGSFVTVPAP
jgi:hypothetical protein